MLDVRERVKKKLKENYLEIESRSPVEQATIWPQENGILINLAILHIPNNKWKAFDSEAINGCLVENRDTPDL